MLRKFCLAVLLFYSNASFYLHPEVAKPCFGVNINIRPDSEVLTFAAFFKQGNNILHKRIYRQDEFIKILSGEWPSMYNPEKKNLLMERQINGGIIIDSFSRKKSTYCVAFDSLWKIKFKIYPFRSKNEPGWAKGQFKPSDKQNQFLIDNYQIKYLDFDYFIDEAFWRLLHDVNDTTWINHYKKL